MTTYLCAHNTPMRIPTMVWHCPACPSNHKALRTRTMFHSFLQPQAPCTMPGIQQGFIKCSEDERSIRCHRGTGEAQAGRIVSARVNRFITTLIIFHLLHCRHLSGHRAGEECPLKLEFGNRKHHCCRQELSGRGVKLVTRS